jgi:hypothetical protein
MNILPYGPPVGSPDVIRPRSNRRRFLGGVSVAVRQRLGGSRYEGLDRDCDDGRYRSPDSKVRVLATRQRRANRPPRGRDQIHQSSCGPRPRLTRARLSPLRLDMCSPRWLSGLCGRGVLRAMRVRVTRRRRRDSHRARAGGITVSPFSRVRPTGPPKLASRSKPLAVSSDECVLVLGPMGKRVRDD